MTALDSVIGLTVIGAAVVVLAAPRLAAAVAFLVFGVVLATLWAVLGAPDIALAEAALGTGVTGALFIEAITREQAEAARASRRLWWAGTGLVLLTAAVLLPVFARVAEDAPAAGLGPVVEGAMPDSGVAHPVTAVLLAFRAYDTLLEIAVLFAAVVVAVALAPARLSRSPGRSRSAPNPLVAAFVPRVLPVVVVAAGWFLFAGSALPGGAFQGAAVLAGALLLVRVTGRLRPRPGVVAAWAAGGLLSFLAVATLGAPLGAWLALPPAAASATIVALETALTLSIAVSLAVLVTVVGRVRPATAAETAEVGDR
ncbi:MAG: DUF4040 domain-containing protein [Propionibacteriaceae bacterium]|nr:DUF4040 domain-containing protein [Propionibacteriaceae bacterium]